MNNSSSKSAGDIFDRLFKTDTYATNAMKRNSKYVKPNEEPPKKPAGITTNAFFDRMSKTDTYATKDMKGKIPACDWYAKGIWR